MQTSKYVVKYFIRVSGALLMVTAVAKLLSANGNAGILQETDPILFVTFQHLFWFVGTLELVVAAVCIFSNRISLQSGLIAWLATLFVVYRVGLIWVGYREPCHCLGTLTQALNILPQTADTAMKVILAYLLIGSYAALFWLWRQKRKAVPA